MALTDKPISRTDVNFDLIPDPMTSGEVAALFGVDVKTVSRWANDGKLSYFRTPGNHRRFHRSEIIKYLSE